MYWLAILMEPTVTEEVIKEIDECQVLLLLCLIVGATSVLLLNVLCIWSGLRCFDCLSASLSARTTATLRQVQCLESSSELFCFNGF